MLTPTSDRHKKTKTVRRVTRSVFIVLERNAKRTPKQEQPTPKQEHPIPNRGSRRLSGRIPPTTAKDILDAVVDANDNTNTNY